MKKVMFVCKKNSRRSQMAEGFARTLGEGKISVNSSGLEASHVDPKTVDIMSEVGVDISNQTSKPLSDFQAEDFDPEGQPIETFRRVRDEVKERVAKLIESLS
jgi:arsenate reductase (thioredoxin)